MLYFQHVKHAMMKWICKVLRKSMALAREIKRLILQIGVTNLNQLQ